MASVQYAALLRGINVGGKNIIKMADLQACLAGAGLVNVATYIQSGNVLFEAGETNHASLAQQINGALSRTFKYEVPVVLRSHAQMRAVVAQAPAGFGSQPDLYRYDVLFLRDSLTPAEALAALTTKDGVDEVAAGPGVIYFSRLTSRASQSHMSRMVSLPLYQHLTGRNWNTTTKLLALMDARTQE